MNIHNEDQLQAACIQQARNDHPEIARLIWAVPNSAASGNKVRQQILIATGLLASVWDVHLYWKSQLYIFEFKWGSNQLTRDTITRNGGRRYGQHEWGVLMSQHGAICHIIHARDEEEAPYKVWEFLATINRILI